MSLAYRYHPEAREELEADVVWYERREQGLGASFLEEVVDAVLGAAAAPESWPYHPHVATSLEVRRRVLTGFPYAIAYKVYGNDVVIVAVSHSRRRPGYWRHRV